MSLAELSFRAASACWCTPEIKVTVVWGLGFRGLYGGFLKLGYHFGGPRNRDYSILGLYRGPSMRGNFHLVT